MEISFRNWVFSCVSIGTSSSNEVFTKFEGGFVSRGCWVSMLYQKREELGEKCEKVQFAEDQIWASERPQMLSVEC